MALVVRAATRGSALARWQTDHVAALLRGADPSVQVEVVVVETAGDRRLDLPIWEIGGKGVFVKEVQAAVLDGRADIAVHSAKDLPSVTHEGLRIAAVPERADARDVLIGSTLDALPPGATVGTGSVRRRAQLAWTRPDLTFGGLRGNIGTRLARAPEFGAIVMALAPLVRLGLLEGVRAEQRVEVLDPSVMLPQVGQGSLAVECLASGAPRGLEELLVAVEHDSSRAALEAERGFLAELGGDCDLPAGAHAVVAGDGSLHLDAVLASLDGHTLLRAGRDVGPTGPDPAQVGRALARHLLVDAGGAALLDR